MKDLTLIDFTEKTAGNSPTPGGGSVAALCGALSGSLVEMVANLTIGRKKYIEHEGDMLVITNKAASLRESLLEDIEKDSNAYKVVMEAYKLPRETVEEKGIREIAIQNSLKYAAEVPLEVARKAYTLMNMSEQVIVLGNKNAITDGLVALMVGRTAVLAALLNVKINLIELEDSGYVDYMKVEVDELEKHCLMKESEVLKKYGM